MPITDAAAQAYAALARERARVGKPPLTCLADDMRRRFGMATPADLEEVGATAPQLRVDLVADMRRRCGMAN
jgi:hypothetical protein